MIALILAVVGFCLLPLYPVAFVLAIFTLVRSREPSQAAGRSLAMVTLVLVVPWVPVAGLVVGVSLPMYANHFGYGEASPHHACKSALRNAYVAEKVWFADHRAYSVSPKELGFESDGQALVRFGQGAEEGVGELGGPVDRALPHTVLDQLGLKGTCPLCEITIGCAMNLDADATLDVWTVSTAQRVGPLGPLEPGELSNDVNDLER
jgi:type IV pilus assembly protein PilA